MEIESVLHLFIGLQASGKSTFARKYLVDCVYVNLDSIRNRKKEYGIFLEALESRRNIVIDNTNPTIENRKRYIKPALERGYKIKGYFFQSKLQECMARNEKRDGRAKVPAIAIAATSNKLELPSYREGFDQLYFVSMCEAGFKIDKWIENEV